MSIVNFRSIIEKSCLLCYPLAAGILVTIVVQQSIAVHMYGSNGHCSSEDGTEGGTCIVGNCVNYTRRALAWIKFVFRANDANRSLC